MHLVLRQMLKMPTSLAPPGTLESGEGLKDERALEHPNG